MAMLMACPGRPEERVTMHVIKESKKGRNELVEQPMNPDEDVSIRRRGRCRVLTYVLH